MSSIHQFTLQLIAKAPLHKMWFCVMWDTYCNLCMWEWSMVMTFIVLHSPWGGAMPERQVCLEVELFATHYQVAEFLMENIT